MFKVIDWFKVSHAVMFYKSIGYNYLETPWVVPIQVCDITRPPSADWLRLDQRGVHECYKGTWGEPVASGEQGLLNIRGQLEVGKLYVTATPCFRPERELVEGVTQGQFFKVELMATAHGMMNVVLDHARRCMTTWCLGLEIVTTAEGCDLYLNGLEVGSYGEREHNGFKWTYGTGIAEPRFTTALGK